jgi:toxin ParE1/3/4
VARFRLTVRAEADLLSIGSYTLEKWGALQASRYLDELEECCQRLADAPLLGRQCDNVRPGLRRMEHGRHTVFYRPKSEGVAVIRILHQDMLPRWSAFEEEDL